MKITLENNETHELDMTIDEVKKKLGIEVEFPQRGSVYWFVNDEGVDCYNTWVNHATDRYRLAHGNCSPTRAGRDTYKADMAKLAAIVAIRKHRDKTFGVFEPRDNEERVYGKHYEGSWGRRITTATFSGITVPFFSVTDIERSFVECADAWEVLK